MQSLPRTRSRERNRSGAIDMHHEQRRRSNIYSQGPKALVRYELRYLGGTSQCKRFAAVVGRDVPQPRER